MAKTEIEGLFTTTDVFLVIFLLYKNFLPCKPHVAKKRYVTFFFEKTPELEQTVSQYRNRLASREPVAFIEKWRTVRMMTWDARNVYVEEEVSNEKE